MDAAIQVEEAVWVRVCSEEEVSVFLGVCALVEGQQIAIFRTRGETEDEWYAIGNYDPFSAANVLSRGIVGDVDGIVSVASPVYKQHFCLRTGQCLEDENVCVPVYGIRIAASDVEILLNS